MKSKNLFPLLIIPLFTYYCQASDNNIELKKFAFPALNFLKIQSNKKIISFSDGKHFQENSCQKFLFSSNNECVIQNITSLKIFLDNLNTFYNQKNFKPNKYFTENTKYKAFIYTNEIKTKLKTIKTTYFKNDIAKNIIIKNLIPSFINEDSYSS